MGDVNQFTALNLGMAQGDPLCEALLIHFWTVPERLVDGMDNEVQEIGLVLRVAAIANFSRVRRLEDIGLLPGESLTLRRRLSNGSVVVEVKGSEVALSAEVAACILVEVRG